MRYATGSSSLPGGFVTEMSVLASDGLNSGRDLDSVDGDWYPKCWPEVDPGLDDRIESIARDEVPVAQERLGAVMAEIMSLFQSR